MELTLGCVPAPGIYYGVPDEIYFSLQATSKSDLDLIDRAPAVYRAHQLGTATRSETKSMSLGKALHAYCLQTQEFSRLYSRPLTREACERQGIKLVEDRGEIQAMVTELNDQKLEEMRQQGIIMEAEQLVDMIAELNKDRLPKLATSGNKADMIARITENWDPQFGDKPEYGTLTGMKGPDLKNIVERLNEARPGLLSTNGSKAELAQRLRDEGQQITCKWEVIEAMEAESGRPYLLGSGCSRHEMVDWLNAEGFKGGNWKLWDQVKAEWTENNPGKTLLTDEQFAHLNGMRDSLMNHPTASKIMFSEKAGHAEVVVVWNDPDTGELCRCKIDGIRFNGRPFDLKTTNDASERGFRKSIENYGYDRQEAHYLNGVYAATGKRWDSMPFVCVESEPPYLCAVHTLLRPYKLIGAGRIADNLQTLKKCREQDYWPGYGDDPTGLEPTAWYKILHNQYLPDEF